MIGMPAIQNLEKTIAKHFVAEEFILAAHSWLS